jgi:two-component system sensor histidine kinase UhpB
MRAPRSVRTYVVGLIIGVLLPLLGFSGFLVIRSAEHEQDALALATRNRTRIATAAIGDELGVLRSRLFLLAGGLNPQTSDLADFQARAREAFGGMTITLSNAAGAEIVNTSVPHGDPLPANPDIATVREVAKTSQPLISDMAMDPATHRMVVTINVPVTRDGQLAYVLSVDISSTLQRILAVLDLPDGWVAAMFDRTGHMIARSRDPELYIGTRASREFMRHIETEDEGWVPGVSREGVPLFTAFAHAPLSGWTITVGIPRASLLAPVRHTTLILVLLGGATLTLAVVFSVLIGRRIASPVMGLVPLAEAVGRGEAAPPGETGLKEANLVAQTLFETGEGLRRAAAEREAATEALTRSERKYRALAEDLARVDKERTALLDRVVVAQETERKRIARELHDSFAQYLTALRLKLDMLDRAGGERSASLNELRSLIGELGHAVNRMAWELRPVALDELGLHSAVDHYLEEWAEMARMQVDVAIDLCGQALPPAVETTLFRVLQEATTNVLRHAGANRTGVILNVKDGVVRLIIEDNGKGFPADRAASPFATARRFGLNGMRERLALVHGQLDVESTPGHGTTLFISIPLVRVPVEAMQGAP